jgi:hypothetical protein
MSGGGLRYDAGIIAQFARNLYRKAELITTGSTAVGALIGAAFGAVPLTSLGETWPISRNFGFATLLLGGIAGAVLGYVIGDARAFGYRLSAQVAICQIQIERTTAQTARTLAALTAAVESLRAQAAPAPRAAAVETAQPPPPPPVPAPAPAPSESAAPPSSPPVSPALAPAASTSIRPPASPAGV